MNRIRALVATVCSVALLTALLTPIVMTAGAKTVRPVRATRAGRSAHAASLCSTVARPTPGTVLWVRSGPGTNYPTIGYLYYGEPIVHPCGMWPWIYNYGPYSPQGWVNAYYTGLG